MPWIFMGNWRYSSTMALVGGEWSLPRLCSFIPREASPDPYCMGGWVGPTVGLDRWRRENFLPLPGIKLQFLGCPACGLVTILTEQSVLNIILRMGKMYVMTKKYFIFSSSLQRDLKKWILGGGVTSLPYTINIISRIVFKQVFGLLLWTVHTIWTFLTCYLCRSTDNSSIWCAAEVHAGIGEQGRLQSNLLFSQYNCKQVRFFNILKMLSILRY